MGVTRGLGAAVAGMLLAGCPCAFALNPALDVSQYTHTVWRNSDGFAKGAIFAIAQTPDGYLWLGTAFGMLRFDGVRAVAWTPPAGPQLPSNFIYTLFVSRDGTLWIGTGGGLASWKSGRLTRYAELDGIEVEALLEDPEGSIWIGGVGSPAGRLCAIRSGRIQCYGNDGLFGTSVRSLREYQGYLWVGTATGLWRWTPDPTRIYPISDPLERMRDLVEGDNGALWIATERGLKQLIHGKPEPCPLPGGGQFSPIRLFRDREGGLWIGTRGGLLHVHQGKTDRFASPDGLSSDTVQRLFEDREGNIWVATGEGLDRFRDLAVPTVSVKQGLTGAGVGSVLAASDGSVWMETGDGLNRWNNGQITVYRNRTVRTLGPPAQQPSVREVTDSGLPDNSQQSFLQDQKGRIWVATTRGLAYFEDGRFVSAGRVPVTLVHSMVDDRAGGIWINDQAQGLLHWVDGRVVESIAWAKLDHRDHANALAADPAAGGLWVGFTQGGIVYLRDGRVQARYASGQVNELRFGRDGALRAATEGGLVWIKDGRIAILTHENGLPCDAVHWAIEDDAQSIWMGTACGLIRFPESELASWAADPKRTIQRAVFDISDGVKNQAGAGGYSPHASKSPDGRLWFVTEGGVSVVDPRHLPFNKLPPPVVVETVRVNGKEVAAADRMELSHSSNDLEIDYTALSLTNPERMQFRYKLEGHDADWQDVGTRRQAFYGGLAPKQYRFRVMASNNDGVWNEAGAAWGFRIVPAYYQTVWFRTLIVLAGAGMIWLAFRLRVRQVTARVNLLYNERLAERTRIARDLHDTLLQSLAGVSLQLDGISKQAGKAPEKVPSLISRVRDQVDSAFREARVKVWDLRSTALEAQGLEGALRQLVERMGLASSARCEVTVSGEARPCAPEVEEELLRIAQESANNANRHAQASEIRIGLAYGSDALTLSIADNGRGFDFAEGYGKSGHWGLKNMQERAEQIRGTCKVTTAVGQGTQIEVRVPLSGWTLRNALLSKQPAKRSAAAS
jgi:signal transduction histidine kinase/ligand-binding sensor domain-containing protein